MCFPVNIGKFLRTPIRKTFASGCFCILRTGISVVCVVPIAEFQSTTYLILRRTIIFKKGTFNRYVTFLGWRRLVGIVTDRDGKMKKERAVLLRNGN